MRSFYERYVKRMHPLAGAGICLLAALCFAAVMFWASADSQRQADEIHQRAEEQKQDKAEEIQETQPLESNVTDNNISEDDAAPEESQPEQSSETAAVQTQPAGISCRGDDFMDSSDSPAHAYPVYLQELMNANGKNIPVVNKGLYGAGTLSQLKLAGVADAEIQAYIDAHTAAAQGAELAVTETGVRDFSPEELARTDQSYLPVLFLGFYGGWNNDPQELIGQQEKILATFTGNPDQYLILGYPNTGSAEGDAAYEEAMRQRWQEHYVSLKDEMQGSVYTYAGQEEMAQIVYRHLEALGYLG